MSAETVVAAVPSIASGEPFQLNWCGLPWTPWAPLDRGAIRRTAPALSGVYRIRREGGESRCLVYIGQTGRTLRERLLSLAGAVNAGECPFNDPHTAAPHLWLMRQDGARFEWSCAAVSGDVQVLRGTEDMLLWRHRVELGLSAEANYGRFYRGYARPTNRWIVGRGSAGVRRPGRRATLLPEGAPEVDYDLSHPVLQGDGGPVQAPGWTRAPLQGAHDLPTAPAVYCIHDRDVKEAVYIGETAALARRAAGHAASPWPVREPWIAWLSLPQGTPKHVLRELESDLLGWHFWLTGRAPAVQYRFLTAAPAGCDREVGE